VVKTQFIQVESFAGGEKTTGKNVLLTGKYTLLEIV